VVALGFDKPVWTAGGVWTRVARLAGIDLETLEQALPGITQLPEMPPPPPPLTEEEELERLQELQSQASKLKVLKAGMRRCA